MYICRCCNHQFEQPSRESEMLGGYEHESDACPFCHSEEICRHVLQDIYGDYIYSKDLYYLLGDDVVAEDNIKEYLKDCRYEA